MHRKWSTTKDFAPRSNLRVELLAVSRTRHAMFNSLASIRISIERMYGASARVVFAPSCHTMSCLGPNQQSRWDDFRTLHGWSFPRRSKKV